MGLKTQRILTTRTAGFDTNRNKTYKIEGQTARTDWVKDWEKSCQEREKNDVLLRVLPQVYPACWELPENWPSSGCIRQSHMQVRSKVRGEGSRWGERKGWGGVCGMGMSGLKLVNATFTQVDVNIQCDTYEHAMTYCVFC